MLISHLVICNVESMWFCAVNFQNPELGLCVVGANEVQALKQHIYSITT